MLPSSQLRPDRVLPDTGSTVLGVNKHGERRIISVRWSRTKKLWGSRTRSTLHHQETSENIQPTKSVGGSWDNLCQAIPTHPSACTIFDASARSLLHTYEGPKVTVRVFSKDDEVNKSGGYQSACNSQLYRLNNVPSVRVAHCLPSNT